MKPLRTQQRWAKLTNVFSLSNIELDALIAPLCVLYEDLRIEIAGIEKEEILGMDDCGRIARRLYFQRRSFATLHEFGVVVEAIQGLSQFQIELSTWDEVARRHWSSAVAYFRRHKRDLERIRHNAGGHFQEGAGKQAVRGILRDAVGSIEVCFYRTGGGAKLLFASEIAGTVVLQNIRGETLEEKARRMAKMSLIGYHHAVRAVNCVSVMCLWDRFGK